MKTRAIMIILGLAGCVDLPRDPDETLKRVRTTKVLRTGIISDASSVATNAEKSFITKLANETGSTPEIATGPAEELLPKIERGELDIVVGRFGPTTPWNTRVTMLPPVEELKEHERAPRAVVRNGENAWAAFLHKHAQTLTEAAR
ncbi:hypothetical protein [Sphingobium vermicomposti]|uniref:ABC transporter substrate-binding protein n=1 Tax=Sphingobium vermicomposti TaxID=529005 RepID=A0A846MEP1_9SPHN|nr:hypothetical protein [Sphingobium vermicomposti]NIJ16285.1 hypothetical protein [Sphingobium vermicomposti]